MRSHLKQVSRAATALKCAVAGAFLLSGTAQAATWSGWELHYDKDKLTDVRSLRATLNREIEGGGQVLLSATCNKTTIAVNFSIQNRGSLEVYTQAGDDVVPVIYRIDGKQPQSIWAGSPRSTSADVVIASEFQAYAGDVPVSGILALLGRSPLDLREFLHAREVRFQLPLSDGGKHVASIYPQEASFQKFVKACGIDIRKMDADAAKRDADERAAKARNEAEERRAAEEAARRAEADRLADEAAAQEAAAANARAAVVRAACLRGGEQLRTISAAELVGADAEEFDGSNAGVVTFVQVATGEIVQTVSNSLAVRHDRCFVRVSREGHWIRGRLLISNLAQIP